MPLVTPTQRWMGPVMRIPRLGKIRRHGNDAVQVTDEQAAWLFQRFMATPVVEDLATASVSVASETTTQPGQETTRQPDQETTHQPNQEGTLGDLGIDPTAKPPDWQTRLVSFFNTAESKDAIASAIKGIGPKTAEDLIQARPLTWDTVDEILSNPQVEAAKTWVEQQ